MLEVRDGLRIRKIDEGDLDANWDSFLSLRNDVNTALQIMSRPFGQSRDDIRNWIRSRNSQSGCFFFGVFLNDRFCGYVMFTEECRISGVGEISMTLTRDARGKGIGGSALNCFINYLYDALDYRKFMARILEFNVNSIRVFEKNGFHLVGSMERHRKIRGTYHNVRLYEKIIDGCSSV